MQSDQMILKTGQLLHHSKERQIRAVNILLLHHPFLELFCQ